MDSLLITYNFWHFAPEGTKAKLGGSEIEVSKRFKDKMYVIVNGKRKTLHKLCDGNYYGTKEMSADLFDNFYRNTEGEIIVDLLNINNPFHTPSIFYQIGTEHAIK